MKINQLLKVVLASLIINIGFFQKLPATAIAINSSELEPENINNQTPTNGNANLSQFSTKVSQYSQDTAIDCNLKNQDKAGTSIPEPTLITGLICVAGVGLWSKRKKLNRN